MRIDVVSIFPDYLAPLHLSLVGKAIDAGVIDLNVHDLRVFTHDRHHTVDDTPYGGGPGMVMSPQPWGEALDAVAASDPARRPVLVVPTPSGIPFTQATAQDWAADDWLVFACGRYEGIDARVMQHYAAAEAWAEVREVSVGDFVLAGGEAAVLAIVEAVARLLPGVLGNAESVVDDSFAEGRMSTLLEGPVYTKPPTWRGLAVPEVLLSGHHGRIADWRHEQALQRTRAHRPDLLDDHAAGSWSAGAAPWEPPLAAGELAHLVGALERMRATFRWKADGLDANGLRLRLDSSNLSIGGLLKHLASVEDFMFSVKLRGVWDGPNWGAAGYVGDDDWFFASADDNSPEQLYAFWDGAVGRSRARLATALADGGLDQRVDAADDAGVHASLRRLLFDLLEEYGRHTGHADLLREAIDGRVGEDPPHDWRPVSGDFRPGANGT